MTGLEGALTSHFGRRIEGIACRPSSYLSTFLVNEIDVRLDDGTVVELVAKAVQWDAKSPEAARAKPWFLWNERREVSTYESILSRSGLDTPQYVGTYVDADDVRYLLIERIHGVRLWEGSEFEPWLAAARWLARLHATVSADTAAATAAGAHLLRYDEAFYHRWIERALAFNDSGDLNRLAARHPHVVAALLEQTASFIHGEFYSANVLVATSRGALAIRPVDWELAATGPALVDLAHLVAGQWSDEERAAIAEAYFAALESETGRKPPAREQYLRTLDCCLIQLSIQNLGWSDAWTPPREHEYGWLGEALRLCEKWQI